jgi:hypothetical protein
MSSDTELEKAEGGSLLLNDEVWIRCASWGFSGRGPLAVIRRDVQGERTRYDSSQLPLRD